MLLRFSFLLSSRASSLTELVSILTSIFYPLYPNTLTVTFLELYDNPFAFAFLLIFMKAVILAFVVK